MSTDGTGAPPRDTDNTTTGPAGGAETAPTGGAPAPTNVALVQPAGNTAPPSGSAVPNDGSMAPTDRVVTTPSCPTVPSGGATAPTSGAAVLFSETTGATATSSELALSSGPNENGSPSRPTGNSLFI